MKRTIAIAAIVFSCSNLSAATFSGFSFAPLISTRIIANIDLTYWCVRGDNTPCSRTELSDPVHYRQVLVMPAGYTSGEYAAFKGDFDALVSKMSNEGGSTYATARRDHLLYIGAWIAGQALNSGAANFGAKVTTNPFRGKALTLKSGEVFTAVNSLQSSHTTLKPFGVLVLFNTLEDGITANAVPPSYTGTGYGIAKMTRHDLGTAYTGIHEFAHASLSFLDEYVESGFEELNIQNLDILTPLTILDGSWGSWINALGNFLGIYSMKISEVLASNGNDNMDVTRYPSRVATPYYSANPYEYEGGAFFGRGTFHDAGNNIMNGNNVMRGPDDGFAYAHSASQTEVVKEAFEDPAKALRPNDRIRNAGPLKSWALSWGSTVRAMMFDADKHHAFHPTKTYDVQVSWQERTWNTCYRWGIPYPCIAYSQKTVQKTVTPEERHLNLKTSSLYGLASLTQNVLCTAGITQIGKDSGAVDLCGLSVAEMSSTLLPSIEFKIPYQDVSIPTDQKLTTYQWRFRTTNGTFTSGWTGWTSFFKAF